MSNITTKDFFEKENVKEKFQKLLGNKSTQFITSVIQLSSNNKLLASANATSIYNAAATAAILDLPVLPSLGRAYIVPYKGEAQFQIGYKGLITLAVRSGFYRTINSSLIYENQFESWDPIVGVLKTKDVEGKGKVVGYVAFFEMLNGFTKTEYWTKKQVEDHGRKYSKSFTSSVSPWQTDFDKMGQKTVLKSLLNTYGELTQAMQIAVSADQAVCKNDEGTEFDYIDSKSYTEAVEVSEEEIKKSHEERRIYGAIQKAETASDLENIKNDLDEKTYESMKSFFEEKIKTL